MTWSIGFILAILLQGLAPKEHTRVNAAVVISMPDFQDRVQRFWKWFRGQESHLRKFETDPGKYLQEIKQQSDKIKEGLTIELEPPKNGVINMTISANGDKTLFPIVQSIIHKAPAIKGWHFFAFRQRLSPQQAAEMVLIAGEREMKSGEMKFYPVVDGDSLDIIVYVRGLTGQNFNQVAYAGLLIIDNILGEYDCVMKVRHFDFQELPANKKEQEELKPLLDLAKFVDSFHARLAPNK